MPWRWENEDSLSYTALGRGSAGFPSDIRIYRQQSDSICAGEAVGLTHLFRPSNVSQSFFFSSSRPTLQSGANDPRKLTGKTHLIAASQGLIHRAQPRLGYTYVPS